jgi:uroporphyrinogen III methyltransferase/synthase
MTLRGYEALKKADVVIYDRLLGSGILALLPAGAEKICVGKSPDRHPVPQEEINRILVRKALEGSRVVRLKGGDPFLFGRGGEELEELRKYKIPYEVIPGVSSAIAVPAYAGIPVTHRDYSSSLHIFTGHFSGERATGLDYPVLARLQGTLVFLMGVSSAGDICEGLLQAGMPGATPAAVIENGTGAYQRSIIATLETIAGEITDQGIHSPAVIVVGKTAALADRLAWINDRPLHGKRIIVTRPRAQGKSFCEKIESLGGEAIAFPCIETVPVPAEHLSKALKRLGSFTWISFSSAAGVECFFDALHRTGRDTRALYGVRIAAVGAATAKRLEEHGILPDLIPQSFDSRHLGELLVKKAGPEDNVLIIRARDGSRILEEQFGKAGIRFESVPVYKTRFTGQNEDVPEIRKIIESHEFDLVTFTSASTVRGFVRAFPLLDLTLCAAVCIGRETADAAEKCGMHTVVAQISTMDGMLDAITHLEEGCGDCIAGQDELQE